MIQVVERSGLRTCRWVGTTSPRSSRTLTSQSCSDYVFNDPLGQFGRTHRRTARTRNCHGQADAGHSELGPFDVVDWYAELGLVRVVYLLSAIAGDAGTRSSISDMRKIVQEAVME